MCLSLSLREPSLSPSPSPSKRPFPLLAHCTATPSFLPSGHNAPSPLPPSPIKKRHDQWESHGFIKTAAPRTRKDSLTSVQHPVHPPQVPFPPFQKKRHAETKTLPTACATNASLVFKTSCASQTRVNKHDPGPAARRRSAARRGHQNHVATCRPAYRLGLPFAPNESRLPY